MTFDYAASAELFIPKGKPGARRSPSYRRFATAVEAIRFAAEEFPAVRTLGAWMKVGEERFNGDVHPTSIREYQLSAAPPHAEIGVKSAIDLD
jgi:hypothetical protein